MIVGVIQNGGLETGDFTGWVIDGHVNDPVVTNTLSHTGTYSALAGLNPQQETFCAENNNEPLGDSSFYQQFTVPAGGGTLSFWYWTCTFDFLPRDWQDAYVTDSNGAILQTIFHQCSDHETWVQQTVDMGPYAGQTVRIKFLVHHDGRNPPATSPGCLWTTCSYPRHAGPRRRLLQQPRQRHLHSHPHLHRQQRQRLQSRRDLSQRPGRSRLRTPDHELGTADS